MSTIRRYPPEVRERAVRMVLELREETGQRTGTVARVAEQLGINRAAGDQQGDAAQLGWPGRGRRRSAARDPGRRAPAERGAGTREPGAAPRQRDPQGGERAFRRGARPSPDEVTRMIDAHRD